MLKQREALKKKWKRVKNGSYSREKFEKELKEYNNRLLRIHMVIFIALYIIYASIQILYSSFNWIESAATLIIGGIAGFLSTLIIYQSKRLEISHSNKDQESSENKNSNRRVS